MATQIVLKTRDGETHVPEAQADTPHAWYAANTQGAGDQKWIELENGDVLAFRDVYLVTTQTV